MNETDFEYFRDLLIGKEQSLVSWLDQYGVSDADGASKVRELLSQVKDALQRIVDKTYSMCKVCDGPVQRSRLEIQPAYEICLDCISEKEKQDLQYDLNLAGKIHRALLPQTIADINGYNVAVKSLTASSVGGDYYDFLPTDDNTSTRVLIADVMGKGIPAGLIMSNLQSALRILAEEIMQPGKLVARLNRWLCRNVPITKFISLVCLQIHHSNKAGSEVIYTNAGHCPPLLIRNNGSIEQLEPTGGVLGVHEGFNYSENIVKINAGDMLMMYTDGLVELENNVGEMFSEERLMAFLKHNLGNPLPVIIDSLFDTIRAYSQNNQFDDDMTVIALRKK